LSKTRELIISPKVSQAQLTKFIPQLEDEGIKMVYVDPKKLGKIKTKLQTVFPSSAAKYVILEKEKATKPKGAKVGRKFQVLSNSDIENILSAAKKGLDFVIIEVKDCLSCCHTKMIRKNLNGENVQNSRLIPL